MRKWIAGGLLAALLAGCSTRPPSPAASPSAAGPDLQVANSQNPGQRLEISSILVAGKTTLLEYYSDQCPPCRQMAPVMEFLAAQRPDLAIRKLNIDRVGHQGIDFDSPLAQQMGLQSVPSFGIYDGQGKMLAQGVEAKNQVREWYSQAKAGQNR
jgi:thioredoxin 1